MKKTMLTLFSLVLVVLFVLSGCEDAPILTNTQTVDVGYVDDSAQKAVFGDGYADGKAAFPIVCIRNAEEMDAFTERVKEHFSMVSISADSSASSAYDDAIARYDESLFQENALLICYAHATSSPAEFEVTDAGVTDRTLSIWVRAEALGVDTAMEGRMIFAEIQQSTVSGRDSFSAIRVSE